MKSIEEICSSIFKEIIKLTENYLSKLGKTIKITKAYIILPKFFTNQQKKSIEYAASSAGIDAPKIVDEPFPEMIGYALDQDLFYKKEDNNDNNKVENNNENKSINKNYNKKIMIIDFGGGKTEIILINVFKDDDQILTFKKEIEDCDFNLGGNDLDNKLMDFCINKFCEKYMYKEEDIRKNSRKSLLNLKLICEDVKIKLEGIISINNFYDGKDLNINITKKDLDKIYNEFYIRFNELIEKNLKKINQNFDKIDEIFLLGRGTKLKSIKDKLINLFGKDKLRDEFNLNEIIPLCTIIKAIKTELQNVNLSLDYRINESLGIAGQAIDSNGKIMIPLIKKYKEVPIYVSKNFGFNLTQENQNISIEIYEGNQKYIKDNIKIGEVNLNGINYIGKVNFTLEFKVDINAKLKVNLKITSNLQKEEIFDLKLISFNKKDKKK